MFFGSAMVDHTSEKLKHVAFSVIIAVAVLTALGSVIISSVSTEGFEINEVTLKKGGGTDAVLLVSIKNLGNSQISNISVTIDGLNLSGSTAIESVTTAAGQDVAGNIIRVNGATANVAASAVDNIKYRIHAPFLDVGDIASAVAQIPNSKSMQAGSSYTITVEADFGGIVAQTGTPTTPIFTTTEGTKTFQTAVVHITRI